MPGARATCRLSWRPSSDSLLVARWGLLSAVEASVRRGGQTLPNWFRAWADHAPDLPIDDAYFREFNGQTQVNAGAARRRRYPGPIFSDAADRRDVMDSSGQ
jgi:hypothetical protein